MRALELRAEVGEWLATEEAYDRAIREETTKPADEIDYERLKTLAKASGDASREAMAAQTAAREAERRAAPHVAAADSAARQLEGLQGQIEAESPGSGTRAAAAAAREIRRDNQRRKKRSTSYYKNKTSSKRSHERYKEAQLDKKRRRKLSEDDYAAWRADQDAKEEAKDATVRLGLEGRAEHNKILKGDIASLEKQREQQGKLDKTQREELRRLERLERETRLTDSEKKELEELATRAAAREEAAKTRPPRTLPSRYDRNRTAKKQLRGHRKDAELDKKKKRKLSPADYAEWRKRRDVEEAARDEQRRAELEGREDDPGLTAAEKKELEEIARRAAERDERDTEDPLASVPLGPVWPPPSQGPQGSQKPPQPPQPVHVAQVLVDTAVLDSPTRPPDPCSGCTCDTPCKPGEVCICIPITGRTVPADTEPQNGGPGGGPSGGGPQIPEDVWLDPDPRVPHDRTAQGEADDTVAPEGAPDPPGAPQAVSEARPYPQGRGAADRQDPCEALVELVSKIQGELRALGDQAEPLSKIVAEVGGELAGSAAGRAVQAISSYADKAHAANAQAAYDALIAGRKDPAKCLELSVRQLAIHRQLQVLAYALSLAGKSIAAWSILNVAEVGLEDLRLLPDMGSLIQSYRDAHSDANRGLKKGAKQLRELWSQLDAEIARLMHIGATPIPGTVNLDSVFASSRARLRSAIADLPHAIRAVEHLQRFAQAWQSAAYQWAGICAELILFWLSVVRPLRALGLTRAGRLERARALRALGGGRRAHIDAGTGRLVAAEQYEQMIEFEAATGKTFFSSRHPGVDYVSFTSTGARETWDFTLRVRAGINPPSLQEAVSAVTRKLHHTVDNVVADISYLSPGAKNIVRRTAERAARQLRLEGRPVPKLWLME